MGLYSQLNGVHVLVLLKTMALNLQRCKKFQSILAGLMPAARDITRILHWVGVNAAQMACGELK